MAKTLTLRHLGNDFKLLIPEVLANDVRAFDAAEDALRYILGNVRSSLIPTLVGSAVGQSALSYTDYYALVNVSVGGDGHNFSNMYWNKDSTHDWDTMWPDDVLGDHKIHIPPTVSLRFDCPANGRYVIFTDTTATVYTESGQRITETSGAYINTFVSPQNQGVIISGVNDWEAFREATSFDNAKNLGLSASFVNTWDGKVRVAPSPNQGLLRLIWDLVRKFGEDDDDPTEDSSDDPYSGDDSPYKPGEDEGGGGDGEDPYDPGDDVDYPDDPDIGLSDSGLLGVYTPSATQLHLLGGYIWSQNFVDSLVKSVYADPMDVIISIGVVPFNIPAAGAKDVKVGDRTASFGETTVRSNYPASDYFNFDCGEVALKSTIGCYLDYAPYTKGHIFIPFVGYVPLDVDYYMEKSIGLKYKVELVTGTAVAFLLANGKVMQQFTCNVKMQVPLTSANAMQMWKSLIETTVAAGALVASGGAGGGAALASGPASLTPSGEVPAWEITSGEISNRDAANITNGIVTKPSFQKSNPHGISGGFVASKLKPYIIVERPNMQLPANQGQYTGYGAYATKKLGDLHGFTRVSSSKLSLPSATGNEVVAIRKALHDGVIIDHTPTAPEGDLVLMRNGSPANQIGKNLTVVSALSGSFRDEANVRELTVRIEKSTPLGFNYIYSSKFNRFYFVDDITVVRTGILDLHCSVDVLESFGGEILANTVIIDKQEKDFNLYLNDDGLKIKQNPLVQTWNFPHGFGEDYEYVMVVAGYQGGS